VTLVQRFGFGTLPDFPFPPVVHRWRDIDHPQGNRFLSHTIALWVDRFLERQCLQERYAENSCLAAHAVGDDLLIQLLKSSITFRWEDQFNLALDLSAQQQI
jgi:hypothetical protein